MKRTILILGAFLLASPLFITAQVNKSVNPLIKEWKTPFNTPPFNQIKPEHYLPAVEEGIKQQKNEIDKIVTSNEKPSFLNTIEALERSGALLTKVNKVFHAMSSANSDEVMQKIDEQITSALSTHYNDIYLNDKLFKRIKAVYEIKDELKLTAEQKKVLENYYLDFKGGGANLNQEEKARLRSINDEMAQLVLKFGNNVRNENSKFKLIVGNPDDLKGLPENLITAAAEKAKVKGLPDKWIFTIDKPTLLPFLQYSEKRELRERMYKAYVARGNNNDELDNKKIFARIISLRVIKANMLGYKRYSDFVLERKMAKNSENVFKLLNDMWAPTVKKAKSEVADMQKIIDAEGGGFKLQPWDWWYYAEKVKKDKYDLNEEMLRPYFKLENVLNGAFKVANKLWGLKFSERKDIQLYHPEVKVYEVREANGKHIGVLYTDYFPRDGKNSGAWSSAFRDQYFLNNKYVTPLIYNVGNFSKPAGDKPALLSIDEVTTLFHEFGHALHSLLQNIHYPSAGDVPTDFGELPSQIMENWAMQPEVLKMYARHYKTGEIIPQDLISKIDNARFFNQGFETLEYIAASILDMDYHVLTEPAEVNVEKFEKEALEKMGLIPEILPRYLTTNFLHIATWGYEAGYYSYLWSATLDSDAFEAFLEKGLFDKATAKSFRENILSKGGSEPLMPLYIKFRGREPGIDALLRKRGLN